MNLALKEGGVRPESLFKTKGESKVQIFGQGGALNGPQWMK